MINDKTDNDTNEQIVTPFETKCDKEGFNYKKIIDQFGCQTISNELLERFIKLTKSQPHQWLRRGIFFAHRDLEKILDDYEKGVPIFLYTGRGPTSESLHLGHIVQFIFTAWLQEVFNCYVVIQIADDEKYYFKDMKFDKIRQNGIENIKDILACNFNLNKTFIFFNRDYTTNKEYMNTVHEMYKHINIVDIKKTFGINDSDCMGKLTWIVYQGAASFSCCYKHLFGNKKARCLIPHAIDQDPYFRITRDVAHYLGQEKPSSIISKFIPSLKGDEKMSSSIINSFILMSDDKNTVFNKIKKHAHSGGKEILKEHREFGANINVDISYQYLRYFEIDDDKLEQITEDYANGITTSGEIKKYCAEKIWLVVEEHQKNRAKLTDEQINKCLYTCK